MTDIRPELSPSNPYYVPKNRYLELKYRCFQYTDWKKNYISSFGRPNVSEVRVMTSGQSRPTEMIADTISELSDAIAEIDKVLDITADGNSELRNLLLKGVTSGLTFEKMQVQSEEFIMTTRKAYYEAYRKFFWILSTIHKV